MSVAFLFMNPFQPSVAFYIETSHLIYMSFENLSSFYKIIYQSLGINFVKGKDNK